MQISAISRYKKDLSPFVKDHTITKEFANEVWEIIKEDFPADSLYGDSGGRLYFQLITDEVKYQEFYQCEIDSIKDCGDDVEILFDDITYSGPRYVIHELHTKVHYELSMNGEEYPDREDEDDSIYIIYRWGWADRV